MVLFSLFEIVYYNFEKENYVYVRFLINFKVFDIVLSYCLLGKFYNI